MSDYRKAIPVCHKIFGPLYMLVGKNDKHQQCIQLEGRTPKLLAVSIGVSISGWGKTGGDEFSTNKLQETLVTIVPSGTCKARMDHPELVNEKLIVCAGGEAEGGPCKVSCQIDF